ncbi:type VI secretion system baseplate subunit TssE [Luteimonas sp. BDR2-5]|uniref:type VI secretion system baseplate subunit TssE n=1 Tax=Proluteimonas luteida TaxID=2878685 RepID=UPI001E3AA7B7|nr:type VI secretion system baseplate subunit TssE [Luteimonas sp. BDR2-5]MCD9027857.1 type VI secretion system baseplate subunit TssE [Luteimonas sp. BDR2-5]
MAELTTQERLQPSLLDRLTDDEPARQEEGRDRRVISAQRLRECVIRDLSWLLNCTNAEADRPLDHLPRVAASVLNFGIPDLTGVARSGLDVARLERRLRATILAFEPRLIADTLRVRVRTDVGRMDGRSLVFDIESDMWAQPIPLNLYLKTEVDLETGRMAVSEAWG